jgi:hypothetical protein
MKQSLSGLSAFLKQLKYTLLVELIQLEQLFRNNTGGTFNWF